MQVPQVRLHLGHQGGDLAVVLDVDQELHVGAVVLLGIVGEQEAHASRTDENTRHATAALNRLRIRILASPAAGYGLARSAVETRPGAQPV